VRKGVDATYPPVLSYEEFHPYGSTSWHATSASSEVSAKRYRYTGMERDGETSLCYYNNRYVACWLARWSSSDPDNADRGNRFAFVRNRPTTLIDADGRCSLLLSWLGGCAAPRSDEAAKPTLKVRRPEPRPPETLLDGTGSGPPLEIRSGSVVFPIGTDGLESIEIRIKGTSIFEARNGVTEYPNDMGGYTFRRSEVSPWVQGNTEMTAKEELFQPIMRKDTQTLG
jgi:RHS repeat-associated protein